MSHNKHAIASRRLGKIITESIARVLRENAEMAMSRKEYDRELCRELFNTETFDEFYRGTGLQVDPRDYLRMSEYFRRMSEFAKRQKGGQMAESVSDRDKEEYESLRKRVAELRRTAHEDDAARDELAKIKPKYLKLRNKLHPSTDNSAMSGKFS